jgi:hypothetical protein
MAAVPDDNVHLLRGETAQPRSRGSRESGKRRGFVE